MGWNDKMPAKKIKYSPKNVQRCASYLRDGGLVSFPTETVFGLGARADRVSALEKIFSAKKRPKEDPLIAHFHSLEQVLSWVDLTDDELKITRILGEKFWPGPLTLLLKSKGKFPNLLNAGSPWVGVRIPSNVVSQELLKACDFPVAAPSANLFGHVSPTRADHVLDDLGGIDDLFILEGFEDCTVGIESAILKIDEKILTYLRPGIIGPEEIRNALSSDFFQDIQINIDKRSHNEAKVSHHVFFDAPGESVTHYAPNIPCFLLTNLNVPNPDLELSEIDLQKTCLIDYNSKFKNHKNSFKRYVDLSVKGDEKVAIHDFYFVLREIEKNEDIERILITEISDESNEKLTALFDRTFRASSGKKAVLRIT